MNYGNYFTKVIDIIVFVFYTILYTLIYCLCYYFTNKVLPQYVVCSETGPRLKNCLKSKH